MAKASSLTAEDRDNLVAYLDGELDDGKARALEAKLARDPLARKELDALKRSWELLDYLPRPEVSSAFSSRTLDRISSVQAAVPAAAEHDFPGHAPAISRRAWLLAGVWSAAIVLALVAGYSAARARMVSSWHTGPADVDALLIPDLRLYENKRLYDKAGDINFLRSLDISGLFDDDT
jgi:anti-sigma factor RsiW